MCVFPTAARCCRDASGMTLEMEAIETSLVKLAPSGWTPSIAYDKDADEVGRGLFYLFLSSRAQDTVPRYPLEDIFSLSQTKNIVNALIVLFFAAKVELHLPFVMFR